MQPDILTPSEAWDAAEEQVDLWIEDKNYQEWKKWRQMRGY